MSSSYVKSGTERSRRFSSLQGILLVATYIAVMAGGMYVMHHWLGYTYGEPGMMNVIVWVEVVLSLLVITGVMLFFSCPYIGFIRPDLSGLKWMLPHTLLLLLMLALGFKGIAETGLTDEQVNMLLLTAVTTALVGFSEETMFRGILLHAVARDRTMLAGLAVSSLLFAALHLVNVFGGSPVQAVIVQFFLTLVFGVFFGLLALRVRSILPLILFHWLWDFTVLGLGSLPYAESYAALGLLATPLSVIMSIFLYRNIRGTFNEKMAPV